MKKLFVLLTMLLTAACSSTNLSDIKTAIIVRNSPVYKIEGTPIYLVILDSCEYYYAGFSNGLTHKGNCKFCKQRKDKENESLNNEDEYDFTIKSRR